MHELQKHPDEAKGAAADFMEFIQTKVSETNRDPKFLFFYLSLKKTLEYEGACSVNMRASTSETKCATMACTIIIDGTKFTPMLMFKGKVFVCV